MTLTPVTPSPVARPPALGVSAVANPPATLQPGGFSQVRGLLIAARPRQWVKNLLVLAAPVLAGVALHPGPLMASIGAVLAFTLAASGTYLINDARDVAADRLHPVKRTRPVAAGVVSARMASFSGLGALAMGLGLGLAIAPMLGLVIAIYGVVSVSYSVWLKHLAIVELAIVVSGFILRTWAGAEAGRVGLSNKFLAVACAGSLFVVVGKRSAEQIQLGALAGQHRRSLAAYSPRFLTWLRLSALFLTIAAYAAWAVLKVTPSGHSPVWFDLSLLPFLAALVRYESCASSGRGGSPEEIMLSDRWFGVFGVAWAFTVLMGLYGP
ncbi:MAG: decaprenyl-phosphate phosphoribosyltransferase [Acidimicrobiales bacterium]